MPRARGAGSASQFRDLDEQSKDIRIAVLRRVREGSSSVGSDVMALFSRPGCVKPVRSPISAGSDVMAFWGRPRYAYMAPEPRFRYVSEDPTSPRLDGSAPVRPASLQRGRRRQENPAPPGLPLGGW